ncbi:MAG: hypothetical protein KDD60_02010 [Bdellovibrionales bacterium]|nr:hypothetical protein [Bdellovibrionales bacterium]
MPHLPVRSSSLLGRNDHFISAATIAAHAASRGEGFRQRDVRFLVDLFSNWIESGIEGHFLPIQNTQIARLLDDIVSDGLAKCSRRKTHPTYTLTRIGLIELLGAITSAKRHLQPEHFFFTYYFIKNYKGIIHRLIRGEGNRFPPSLRNEVEDLLNDQVLLQNQIAEVKKELGNLEQRIQSSLQMNEISKRLFASKHSLSEVAEAMDKEFPYALNSLKSLAELMKDLPPDIGRWELSTGLLTRPAHIWEPSREILVAYLQSLQRLLES